jgi:hypothetical protein
MYLSGGILCSGENGNHHGSQNHGVVSFWIVCLPNLDRYPCISLFEKKVLIIRYPQTPHTLIRLSDYKNTDKGGNGLMTAAALVFLPT